jgi:hypothetical protein
MKYFFLFAKLIFLELVEKLTFSLIILIPLPLLLINHWVAPILAICGVVAMSFFVVGTIFYPGSLLNRWFYYLKKVQFNTIIKF